MTRARARELNYQVNSFLAVQINSSSNGVLLKPCDDFIILRCLGVEPARSGEWNNAIKAAKPEGTFVTAASTSFKGPYLSTPKVV
jgi:hypothetical protein